MSSSAHFKLPDSFRDRDIFQDHQGLLFVTLGHIQPRERVISYLKYIPDESGKWESQGQRYRRVFWGSVDSVVEGMHQLPLSYVTNDSHFQTTLVEPPRQVITKYYSPELRLFEILDEPQDELEATAKEAAEAVHDELNIPFTHLGIAGSILWRGHSITHSDINMNVYGYRQSWLLQNNYTQFGDRKDRVHLRGSGEWISAVQRVNQRIPLLSRDDLENLFTRRRAICIGERCIGITPVLYPDEAPITHNSESYETISSEPVKIRTTIECDEYSIFHPAIYDIVPVTSQGLTVSRIFVYDGAFAGIFRTDDHIEVSGMLQRVKLNEDEAEIGQIMVGTKIGSGGEYIRLLK